MDDLNMPVKDEFGSQPPLELIRQWIDYGFWYDRDKQLPKRVQKMFLLGGMGPPGGGRMSISRRLQSRFNQINVTFPTVYMLGNPLFHFNLCTIEIFYPRLGCQFETDLWYHDKPENCRL